MQFLYPSLTTKAITFSYDDGIEQDRRVVETLNKYELKATFNVSSGLLDETEHWQTEGVVVPRLKSKDVEAVYEHHEVACHSLTHPFLSNLEYHEKVQEILKDKMNLELLLQRNIEGMAYPFGQVDDEMIGIMKAAGLKYGRCCNDTHKFSLPNDVYRLQPTAHHDNAQMFELIETYQKLQQCELSMFYVWGHGYEFDVNQNWEHFDAICAKLSAIKDAWVCTNAEWINYLDAIKLVRVSNNIVTNASMQTIYFKYQEKIYELRGGEHITLSCTSN